MQADRDGLRVSLEGAAAYDWRGQVLSPFGGGAIARSILVRAYVESKTGGGELDWRRLGDPTVLGVQTGNATEARWEAILGLPTPEAGTEYRAVLEERELYETDASQATFSESNEADRAQFLPLRDRLVYVDRFPLEFGKNGTLIPRKHIGGAKYEDSNIK